MARTRNPIEKILGSAVDTAKKVVDVITPGTSSHRTSRSSSSPIPKSVPPRVKETAKAAASAATRTPSRAEPTSSAKSSAPGQGVAYEEWTKAQLYERAQELDIEGRSTMNKQQLIAALRDAN